MSDKIALVMGGGAGTGRATALAFGQAAQADTPDPYTLETRDGEPHWT